MTSPEGSLHNTMVHRGKNYGNDTIDVFNKNCFAFFDVLACLKSILLTSAVGVTLVFILCKIFKYHVFKHKQIQHYAIFYISAIEMVVCMAGFMAGHIYPQLKFSSSFLKLLKFSIICHLHWTSSARAHHKESIIQHAINPGLCLYMIYCIAVALMGMVDIGTSWNECLKPYWLMLSVADFIAVQCFAMAAMYITHKTNCLPAIASFKSAQRRDLTIVVIAYELSAIFSVTFDAFMRFVGKDDSGCSGVFGHSQFFYSLTDILFNLAKHLLPTWAILLVFQPVEDSNRTSEITISGGYSLDGTPNSNRSSIRGFHQYQRMIVPPSILSPDNLIPPPPYTYPSMDSPPSPSNSNSSLSSLTNHADAMGYTNRISLNCNPLGDDEKYVTKFQRGLTTISEESNINMVEALERLSVRSEKSGSSHY